MLLPDTNEQLPLHLRVVGRGERRTGIVNTEIIAAKVQANCVTGRFGCAEFYRWKKVVWSCKHQMNATCEGKSPVAG